MAAFSFEPIGLIRSCFTEKFGIPRQPGLVPDAPAVLEVSPPFDQSAAFRGLEGFSHIWVLFVFHGCLGHPWKATVRPPRLGGNHRMGVFATRSGFRPNQIGQSPARLGRIERSKGVLRLHLTGIDLLDGTPVLDIKPYLPYVDSIPEARGGYARAAPEPSLGVCFSPAAEDAGRGLEQFRYPGLMGLIRSVLSQDPRPAYRKDDDHGRYGMRLWDLNIRFGVKGDTIVVESIDAAVP